MSDNSFKEVIRVSKECRQPLEFTATSLVLVGSAGWAGSTSLYRLLGLEERATAVLGSDLDVNAVAAR